jgi:hypothetical protein
MNVAMHQTLGRRGDSIAEIKPAKLTQRSRATRAGRDRLLNRESLDGRTAVAKAFDQLVGTIHADLGGRTSSVRSRPASSKALPAPPLYSTT